MALRIRKSFKIAPGLRLNVSKSGVSASVGGKGLTANLSKRGTRVTSGLPGSGVSVTKNYSKPAAAGRARGVSSIAVVAIVALVVVAFLILR